MEQPRVISRGTNLVRELGLTDSAFYLIDKVLRRFSRSTCRLYKYYVFSQPVPEHPILPLHRGKDILVKVISRGDSEVSGFPRSVDVLESRYRQGGVCLAAYRKGEFAGYLWLNFAPYFEDEVRCCYHPLPEGKVAWDYDVYIEDSQRLTLVFPRLWEEANLLMRARNVSFTMSRISAFNLGSMSSHQRLGAQQVAALLFICFGHVQMMFSSVRPYLHFSANKKNIPNIRIASADSTE